jgi:arsenite-transporting ATPase
LFEDAAENQSTKTLLGEIFSSVPGIDEAMSFSKLMGSVDKMEFDVIVFDTAPTGHTLRFLNFPNIIEKGLDKLLSLKQKFSSLLSTVGGVFGSKEELEGNFEKIVKKLENLRNVSTAINKQMKDPVPPFSM